MGTVRIKKQEFARLLQLFRKRRNESRSNVQDRLDGLASKAGGRTEWERQFPFIAAGIASLERQTNKTIVISVEELEAVAELYRVPRLMLDPLLSQNLLDTCIVQTAQQFNPIETHNVADDHSVQPAYSFPKYRLDGTNEVAFVCLRLEPGCQSDVHAHPGDELIFVRSGVVEVRLRDSGVWSLLKPGDYIHFYAEQVHEAWNVGTEPAEVFVIRFYQLDQPGTRYTLIDALSRGEFPGRAVHEAIAALAPFDMSPRSEQPRVVADTSGFGRLLRLLCEQGKNDGKEAVSLQDLADRARELDVPISRARFNRLHNATAAARVDELAGLAKVYDIEPLLLYDFTSPAFRDVIIVRKDLDYQPIPKFLIKEPGVTYSVPCRRLHYSDIAIVEIEIEPGCGTPANSHPGHELLIPLLSEAEVRIGANRATVRFGEHLYAHYRSTSTHRVFNSGSDGFKGLVVRFYD